ncbi:MAG: AAC(3) family N-acetyltransferase [Porticoccus sp.]|jgi:aminoglycoside 3-N-acetyltransferase
MHEMLELDIASSLESVGVYPGDILMIHGDAGVASQYRSIQPELRLNHLISKILEYIGPEGTVIVPTFSYSLTRGLDFDPTFTPSEVGLFSEAFRLYPRVKRSRHPIFSVAAFGKNTDKFINTNIYDCFGKNTCFDLLRSLNAKIMTLGLGTLRLTYIHYIEQTHRVKYRHMKKFKGNIVDGDKLSPVVTTFFVRDLSDETKLDTKLLEEIADKQGLLKVGSVGRFPIMSIEARDCFNLGSSLLNENPYALIKAQL